MKILNAGQIKEADRFTIENEPISSIDLMDRAANRITSVLKENFSSDTAFYIFCGMGNNGGDGLAVARMLRDYNYSVALVIVEHSQNGSEDFRINLEKAQKLEIPMARFDEIGELPVPEADAVVIDAILGFGLSRPLEGLVAEVVNKINAWPNYKVAIDSPTGLLADVNTENNPDLILKVDLTICLQQPRLSFFHKSTAKLIGELKVVPIGLHPEYLETVEEADQYIDLEAVRDIYKPRSRFSYKNKHGHLLLMAGGKGKAGAAILAGKGALRAGVGLLTVHSATIARDPFQIAIPEAMVSVDDEMDWISKLPELQNYSAIAAGPGIGIHHDTSELIKILLEEWKGPLVLDADALNILAANPELLKMLPSESILTPHIGEFLRLLGKDNLDENYLSNLREFATKYQVIVVLKDAITTIAGTDGKLHFIDSGTPALSTAGSGDVLTGITGGLVAATYKPLEAAILGAWMHGMAGRLAGEQLSVESVIAGDIPEYLSRVFKLLQEG